MVRCGSHLLPVRKHVKSGYRSGLEDRVGEQLKRLGVDAQYESVKIKYRLEEERTYTPDWKLPNGIFVETKGRFVSDDRKKHLLVRAQHPTYDIRFVFTNSAAKINKGSKTSYADWCTKQGFKFADKLIPESWVKE
jgi:hypothetical protein